MLQLRVDFAGVTHMLHRNDDQFSCIRTNDWVLEILKSFSTQIISNDPWLTPSHVPLSLRPHIRRSSLPPPRLPRLFLNIQNFTFHSHSVSFAASLRLLLLETFKLDRRYIFSLSLESRASMLMFFSVHFNLSNESNTKKVGISLAQYIILRSRARRAVLEL